MVESLLRQLQQTVPSGEQFYKSLRPALPLYLTRWAEEQAGWRAPDTLLDRDTPGEADMSGTVPQVLDTLMNAADTALNRVTLPLAGRGMSGLRAIDEMRGLEAKPGAPDVPTGDTPEEWRQYALDEAGFAGGVPAQLLLSTGLDPNTYAPLGRMGKFAREAAPALKAAEGPGRQMLGRALERAGEAGMEFQKRGDEYVPELIKTVLKPVAQKIPGVDWLMSPSGRSLLNRKRAEAEQYLGSVVQGLPQRLNEAGEAIAGTFRDFAQPTGASLPKGRKQWARLGEGWTAIEDTASSLEGRHRKLAAAKLLQQVADDKNMIDAAAAREIADARRATTLSTDAPGYLDPEEFEAFKNARYARQGAEQQALQNSAQESLEALRDAAFPKPRGRLDAEGAFVRNAEEQALDDEATRLFDEAIGRSRQEVFTRRDMVKTAEDMFAPADEVEMRAFEGTADNFYRQGRAAAAGTATQLAEDLQGTLPGGLDDASAKLIEGAMEVYYAQRGQMLRSVAPLGERVGAVSDEVVSFVTDQEAQLTAAMRKVEGLSNQVTRKATSILKEAYRPASEGVEGGVRAAADEGSMYQRVALALNDSRTLTRALDDAVKAWDRSGMIGRRADAIALQKLLAKNIGQGDVLQGGDWLHLTVNKWADNLGPSYGVDKPSPWVSALNSTLNVWRGSALLSPRFHIGNLLFGLFANDRAGVSAVETAKNLGRNFSAMYKKAQEEYKQLNPDFDPSLPITTGSGFSLRPNFPGMKNRVDFFLQTLAEQSDYMPGVTGAGAELMKDLGRVNGDGAATYAGAGMRSAGAVEFAAPFGKGWGASARNAAILGGAGAVGGGLYPTDNDQERNENIVRGLFGGATMGVISPQLGWASKLFLNAIEEALRKTAMDAGMRPALVNAHEQVIEQMRTLQPRRVSTLQREVTRGGAPVRTAEDLTGLPIPVVAPPGSARPAAVRGALGASRASLLASPLNEDATFALIRMRSMREAAEALERAGDPGAAQARAEYEKLLSGSDPLVRAMHEGRPGPEPPSPNPLAPDPWYEPIAGQRPTMREAGRAQQRADVEQMDRRFAAIEQVEADISEAEAFLAERHPFLQAGPGGDPGVREEYNMAQFHRLPDADKVMLENLYRRREDVHLGRVAPEEIGPTEELERAGLADRSLVPLRVGGEPEEPIVLTGNVPEGAMQKLEDFMRDGVQDDGIMHRSPREIADEAERLGIEPGLAQRIGGLWDGAIRQGENAGMALANRIHGDYGDVSNLTEFLRRSGMFPFMTWGVKMMPQVATWLIQDPRLLIAIDRLNNLTEAELDEAGLPSRYDRLGRTGQLGDAVAEFLLGRPDATIMANVAGIVNPYSEMGRLTSQREPPAPGYQRPPLQKTVDDLSAFGLGLGPVPQLIGRATGLTEDYGSPIFRLSSYAEALSGIGGGRQINPEQLDINIIRSMREGVTGKKQPTLTGSPTLDYAVRQRIAETAYEKTGKAPAGDYKKAMDDPKSAIWRAALRQVEQQRSAQMALGAVVPFRTKFLNETEEAVAQAKRRAGVRSEDLAKLTNEEQSARWRRAGLSDPMAGLFNKLGGTEDVTKDRMVGAYFEEAKKWKSMDPARKYAAAMAYLRGKPLLEEALGERGYLPRAPQPASAAR